MGNQKTRTDGTFVFAIQNVFETDSSFCGIELMLATVDRPAVAIILRWLWLVHTGRQSEVTTLLFIQDTDHQQDT